MVTSVFMNISKCQLALIIKRFQKMEVKNNICQANYKLSTLIRFEN